MASSNPKPPLGFLDLMPEIRNEIYDILSTDIVNTTGEDFWYEDGPLLKSYLIVLGGPVPLVVDPQRNPLMSLAKTCHQLYRECAARAYRTTMFEYEVHSRSFQTPEQCATIGKRHWDQLGRMINVKLLRHVVIRPVNCASRHIGGFGIHMAELMKVLLWGKHLRTMVLDVKTVIFEEIDDGVFDGLEDLWAKMKMMKRVRFDASEMNDNCVDELRGFERQRLTAAKEMKAKNNVVNVLLEGSQL